jgi:hypothetical protein
MADLMFSSGVEDMWGGITTGLGKPDPRTMEENALAQADIARQMTGISEELWGGGAGLRGGLTDRYTDFLTGGFDPSTSPLYRAGRGGIEDQYSQTRENVIGGMARGGQMQEALADVETARATGLGDLVAQSASDEYNKLFGLGYGQPATALTGYQGAGSLLGNIGQQYAQQGQAAGENIKSGASALGMLMFA